MEKQFIVDAESSLSINSIMHVLRDMKIPIESINVEGEARYLITLDVNDGALETKPNQFCRLKTDPSTLYWGKQWVGTVSQYSSIESSRERLYFNEKFFGCFKKSYFYLWLSEIPVPDTFVYLPRTVESNAFYLRIENVRLHLNQFIYVNTLSKEFTEIELLAEELDALDKKFIKTSGCHEQNILKKDFVYQKLSADDLAFIQKTTRHDMERYHGEWARLFVQKHCFFKEKNGTDDFIGLKQSGLKIYPTLCMKPDLNPCEKMRMIKKT